MTQSASTLFDDKTHSRLHLPPSLHPPHNAHNPVAHNLTLSNAPNYMTTLDTLRLTHPTIHITPPRGIHHTTTHAPTAAQQRLAPDQKNLHTPIDPNPLLLLQTSNRNLPPHHHHHSPQASLRTRTMGYKIPPSHAIVLALILVSLFSIGFGICLWRSCGRAVDAEFVALAEGRAARSEGAAV